jgi:hypothetical protein
LKSGLESEQPPFSLPIKNKKIALEKLQTLEKVLQKLGKPVDIVVDPETVNKRKMSSKQSILISAK